MTLVSENIRFMQIFAGDPLGGGVKRHSTLCKKYAKMTATVILYIGFSLCKRLLKWSGKPGKLREFHFAKFVSTLTVVPHVKNSRTFASERYKVKNVSKRF